MTKLELLEMLIDVRDDAEIMAFDPEYLENMPVTGISYTPKVCFLETDIDDNS